MSCPIYPPISTLITEPLCPQSLCHLFIYVCNSHGFVLLCSQLENSENVPDTVRYKVNGFALLHTNYVIRNLFFTRMTSQNIISRSHSVHSRLLVNNDLFTVSRLKSTVGDSNANTIPSLSGIQSMPFRYNQYVLIRNHFHIKICVIRDKNRKKTKYIKNNIFILKFKHMKQISTYEYLQ